MRSSPIPDDGTTCPHHCLSLHVLPAPHRKRLCRDRVLPGEARRIQRWSPENLRASLGRKQPVAAHRVLSAVRHHRRSYCRGLSRSSCHRRRDVRRSCVVQDRTPRLDTLGLSVGGCAGGGSGIREEFSYLDSEGTVKSRCAIAQPERAKAETCISNHCGHVNRDMLAQCSRPNRRKSDRLAAKDR